MSDLRHTCISQYVYMYAGIIASWCLREFPAHAQMHHSHYHLPFRSIWRRKNECIMITSLSSWCSVQLITDWHAEAWEQRYVLIYVYGSVCGPIDDVVGRSWVIFFNHRKHLGHIIILNWKYQIIAVSDILCVSHIFLSNVCYISQFPGQSEYKTQALHYRHFWIFQSYQSYYFWGWPSLLFNICWHITIIKNISHDCSKRIY